MCQRIHYTSICEKSENMMLVTENLFIHPVVALKLNNVTCCALQDASAGSPYAAAALFQRDSERGKRH